EYLLQARSDLETSNLPRPNPLAPAPADIDSKAYKIWKAWESIYAAEGSDWFWWYGADMTTPANDDTPFDQGFRGHLASMYQFMNEVLVMEGKTPYAIPDFKPIIQAQPQPPSEPFTPATAPVLDGLLSPNELEWTELGGFFYDNDSGAQANQDDDVALVYYGYSADALYLGILSNDDLSTKSDYDMFIYMSHKRVLDIETGAVATDPANDTSRFGTELSIEGGAAREVRIAFTNGVGQVSLSQADGSGGWTPTSHSITSGGPTSPGKLYEIRIPFSDLNQTQTDPLALQVVASATGEDVDIAPSLEAKTIFEDPTNVIYVTFECDVTGAAVPLNSYTDIATFPPPEGNGIVYITGNHDKLLQWTPNKVAMLDDGVAPDAVANDGIWTLTVGFPPGTLLRYKYTIGLPQNEGNWSGTEEFPLTERGLDVTKDPTKSKMKVSDVFANRPQPTGTVASMTVVELLE
ncbi:MAG: choice-of-anchor X domain-containing protein, partial [Myxococcota bacterium]|nr:choice-of-anchor X domain-containing protein [Myxococcota bacterium]